MRSLWYKRHSNHKRNDNEHHGPRQLPPITPIPKYKCQQNSKAYKYLDLQTANEIKYLGVAEVIYIIAASMDC